MCVWEGVAGGVRAPWRLACGADTLNIADKSNKIPITSQCLCSPRLVGGELCPDLHGQPKPTGKHQQSKAGFLTPTEFINFLSSHIYLLNESSNTSIWVTALLMGVWMASVREAIKDWRGQINFLLAFYGF